MSLRAQPATRVARIGILNFGDPPAPGGSAEPIVERLRPLGYVDGRNVAYERRLARGDRDAYPKLASELLAQKLDVIYAPGSDIARAFRAESPLVPVVLSVPTSSSRAPRSG